MKSEYTNLLSEKDRHLLERAIIRYGEIVHFEDLAEIFASKYSRQETKDRLSKLVKNGWLVRVYRGLYIIVPNLTSLKFSGKSQLVIAQAINRDSYVSFAAALQYWSMFDQLLTAVDSTTTGLKTRSFVFENTTYRYHKAKQELYFGFTEESIDGKLVKIAEAEKALLDFLYLYHDEATARLVLEKIKEHKDQLDLNKLTLYARHYNATVRRSLGHLLDLASLDSDLLYRTIDKKGSSRMGQKASKFISKWRLYAFDSLN